MYKKLLTLALVLFSAIPVTIFSMDKNICDAINKGPQKLEKFLKKYKDNKDELAEIFQKDDCYSRTPLHYVVSGMNGETRDFLSEDEILELALILLNHGAKNMINIGASHDDSTPLMTAVRNRHKKVVQLLLEYGADINKVTKTGFSAISWAVNNDDTDTLKLLLILGSEKDGFKECINAVFTNGKSPLQDAVEKESLEMVKLLLKYGAQVTKKMQKIKITNEEIKKLLKENCYNTGNCSIQ